MQRVELNQVEILLLWELEKNNKRISFFFFSFCYKADFIRVKKVSATNHRKFYFFLRRFGEGGGSNIPTMFHYLKNV